MSTLQFSSLMILGGAIYLRILIGKNEPYSLGFFSLAMLLGSLALWVKL